MVKENDIIEKNNLTFAHQFLIGKNLPNEYKPLIDNYEKEKSNTINEIQFTFECIDYKEKLLIPIFFFIIDINIIIFFSLNS